MNTPLLFLSLAFVWILQLVLSLFQTNRFNRRISELRKTGSATAVGMSGTNWNLKKYGVLVVNDEREVITAHKLTGMTVFANMKDVPSLSGLPLARFANPEPVAGMKLKLWNAFMNAAEFIAKHDRRLQELHDSQEEQ